MACILRRYISDGCLMQYEMGDVSCSCQFGYLCRTRRRHGTNRKTHSSRPTGKKELPRAPIVHAEDRPPLAALLSTAPRCPFSRVAYPCESRQAERDVDVDGEGGPLENFQSCNSIV